MVFELQLPPLLLLTGPAGVGKTATMKVLAKQLSCDVQEWSNPDSSSTYNSDSYRPEWSRSQFRMQFKAYRVTEPTARS